MTDVKELNMEEPTLGAYRLGKTIGQGTFGKVKLGEHRPTGEVVAIKILNKRKISDVADIERVSRELHILRLIRHPHIVQLYEVIETPKRLFLIMEYAAGGELFDCIVACGRLEEAVACKFFLQLVAGIEYIHTLGIAHRDLKPENLLLDAQTNIKVVDFGLSNTYQPGEPLRTACGSPCYAAPEMIAGQPYCGLGSDLWSAGCILFAMACGYLPFEDADTGKLYKKILDGDFHCPSFLSRSLKDLLARVLNIDPASRYSIQDIRKHPWCQQAELTPRSGILVGYDRIRTDSQVLQQLAEYGYDPVFVQKCVEANVHTGATAAYYLLVNSFGSNCCHATAAEDNEQTQQRSQVNTLPLFRLSDAPQLLRNRKRGECRRKRPASSHRRRRERLTQTLARRLFAQAATKSSRRVSV